jgi:threonine dehydrogenase-like Zn-dependent dehydrogenase
MLTWKLIGPVPKIQEDGDIIVKVEYTALCGR